MGWQPGAVNRYSDLDRPALRAGELAAALEPDGFHVTVLEETESTNAVLADRARDGAAEGTVIVAETQTSGRGRQGRSWVSPSRAGLTFSVLLRPPQISGWLPLLAGLSVAVAVGEQAGVSAGVKWPNDVLIVDASGAARPGKVAGLLAEVTGGAVVIGVGLNVTTRLAELPDDRATSLALAGARTADRETLLKAILRALARAYASWRADPAALMPAYRAACVTIGRRVRVELPGGEAYEGLATDVDAAGQLIVGGRAFAAGDVIHLR